MRGSFPIDHIMAISFQITSVHHHTFLCLILLCAELLLLVGSERTQISFPFFPDDKIFLAFGDAAYNHADRSFVLNRGAWENSTGSCAELLYDKRVRIQDLVTGRVASFSASFSFSFTTQGSPWDIINNPRGGSGLAFVFMGSKFVTAMQDMVLPLGQPRSCRNTRTDVGLNNPPNFSFIINTDYDAHQDEPSNNSIHIFRNYDHELGNPAFSHNLCGNDTHCSYFSNGRIFTAWVDFIASSQTLEVRLVNGSNHDVKKPLQPLLQIANYTMAKELGDDVYLSFWGSADVNHFEAHKLLSWSFFSNGLPESSIPSSQILLHFSRTRTLVGIMMGVFGMGAACMILWSIYWLARPFTNHHRYTALGYPTAGPHVFSYAELRKATEDFDEKNLLGRGASGSVFKGSLEGGPAGATLVAVKQISFSESEHAKSVFQAEVTSLGQIRHRNVVQLQGWCYERGRSLLVYDYMPNGGLDEWLHKSTGHKSGGQYQRHVLSLKMRHSILEGVGAALEYLHEDCPKCILHRDIKSSNVLLDADFKAQLGDFGLARLMDHHKPDKTTLAAGTLGYMAPEIPYTGKATKESDVYSFGILVLEVLCGRRPLDMQAVEPEDLVLLHAIWRAHEVGSLLSMIDPRLLETFRDSKSSHVKDDESIYATTRLPSSFHSINMNGSDIPVSTTVDVDIEVQKAVVINLLRLGLLCCLPNPKARPPMGQVNAMLQQIGDIENTSTVAFISMPSLPTSKPLGFYQSLEFSQTTLVSDSSTPSSSLSASLQHLGIDSTFNKTFSRLQKYD